MNRRQILQAQRYKRFSLGGRSKWPGAKKTPRLTPYGHIQPAVQKRASTLNRAELTPQIRFAHNGPWIFGGRP